VSLAGTPDETARLHAVDDLDRAVMPQLEALAEPPVGRRRARRHAAHGEQELVLLRLEAGGAGRLLAEAEEAAELVAELRQCAVLRRGDGVPRQRYSLL